MYDMQRFAKKPNPLCNQACTYDSESMLNFKHNGKGRLSMKGDIPHSRTLCALGTDHNCNIAAVYSNLCADIKYVRMFFSNRQLDLPRL